MSFLKKKFVNAGIEVNMGASTSKDVKNVKNVQNVPPMMVNQQSQTDFPYGVESDIAKGELKNLKEMMQAIIDMQNEYAQMTEKQLRMESQMKEMTTIVSTMYNHFNHNIKRTRSDDYMTSDESPQFQQPSTSPPKILNTGHDSNYTPKRLKKDCEPSARQYLIKIQNKRNNGRIVSVPRKSKKSPKGIKIKSSPINIMNNAFHPDDIGSPMDLVQLGANGTMVKREVIQSIEWNCISKATRKFLKVLFDRDVLATSSLTGNASPGTLRKYTNIN